MRDNQLSLASSKGGVNHQGEVPPILLHKLLGTLNQIRAKEWRERSDWGGAVEGGWWRYYDTMLNQSKPVAT